MRREDKIGNDFQEGSASENLLCYSFNYKGPIDKMLLGGKGAGLIEMTNLGIPIPPGFIVTTELWRQYIRADRSFPPETWDVIKQYIQNFEQQTGKKLGDPDNPLFVSVRSGAPISMPGILSTKINLGVNKNTIPALVSIIGEAAVERLLRSLPDDFPQDPREQIRLAITEVFNSWYSPKAVAYRQKHNIAELGTSATIQQMVWGNSNKESAGTGVLLTRDTQKYSQEPVVIFASNAQGPSVVDRQSLYPQVSIEQLNIPEDIRHQLTVYAKELENYHNSIPQDIEFTYDGIDLWILQTRTAPLSPLANLRSLMDRMRNGILTEEEALSLISAAHLKALTSHELDGEALSEAEEQGLLLGEGISVSIGNKEGRLVFSLEQALEEQDTQTNIVLADPNLESFSLIPTNVKAVLLDKVGVGSHLAREGTQMSSERNIIAVFGIDIDPHYTGRYVTVDGNSGKVYLESIPKIAYPSTTALLTPQESLTAHKWLKEKRENPWRFFGNDSQKLYIDVIDEALNDVYHKGIRSLKAREIMIFNAAVPREIRQHYTVVKIDQMESLIETLSPILDGIFAKGNHATIRTCHDPALPANGPWAFLKKPEDFRRFITDDNYSEKYGGFPQFLSHPQLTELLVGDIPVGKLEKDPDVQFQHCAWTLSCTENGMVILQVHPHSAHLREHEKAKRESMITFTTGLAENSPLELKPVSVDIGSNLTADTLALELAEIVRQNIFSKWWNLFELPQRLSAITSILKLNTTLEGQATKSWCLGYGIKTR